MFTYLLGVVSVIAMCSTLLVYILMKYNMINMNSLMAIGASTMAGSLFLPIIKTVFVKLSEFISVLAGIILSTGIFLVLIFCISNIIYTTIMVKDIGKLIKNIPGHSGRMLELLHTRTVYSNSFKHDRISESGNMNYSGDVLSTIQYKSNINNIDSCITVYPHYVDTNESLNLKTSGNTESIEVCTLECLEQCIEKAFDFRETGIAAEAILCYMRALELGPEKELASWIAVELCSIYKELGQYDKIKELAKSYRMSENSWIDSKIFDEVEKSLK